MHLIVGLGNPGSEYENTRHNIGFLSVDSILKNNSVFIDKKKGKSLYSKTFLFNQETVVLKPQTFMNLSGSSVRDISSFFKIDPKQIIVIHDDIDLPFGKLRIKSSGGHGGHNGIRDIIKELGCDNFIRIKVGVGRPSNPNIPVHKHVLSVFSNQEEEKLSDLFLLIENSIEKVIISGADEAMNEYNSKTL
jgi:PTH1 family peptidyl-tRNA hydrolase